MKNKVTVSRAHRLRKREFPQVDMGTIYLYKGGQNMGDMFCLAEKGLPPSRLCQPFTLPYEPDLMPNEVVTFDSFDDMCKWVANGKRLEDLPSDDGQCLFSDLEFGELFLIFNGCGAIGMKTDDCKFVEVGACGGATEHPSNSTTIVTRLNIGDTIEITE